MLKKSFLGLVVVLCLIFFVSSDATAQTESDDSTSVDATKLLPQKTQDRLDSIKANAADRNSRISNAARERRDSTTGNLGNLRREKKAEIDELRQERKEENDQRREDFQAKLEELQDQKKAAVVERISENLNSINETLTNRMFDLLEKLEGIMTKIKEKIDNASGDTTEIQALFDAAQEAVENAKDAVTTQAANEYIIELTTDSAVRSNVATTVNNLKTDIRNTYTVVKGARDAVRDTARALVQLNSIPDTTGEPTPEATGSGI